MTDDKQTLMVRSYCNIYMFVVLNWTTKETYFLVTQLENEERHENLREAEVAFDRLCDKVKQGVEEAWATEVTAWGLCEG